MFVENREYGIAGGAQISFTNNKKVNQMSKVFIKFSKNLGESETLVYEYVTKDWYLKHIYLIYLYYNDSVKYMNYLYNIYNT